MVSISSIRTSATLLIAVSLFAVGAYLFSSNLQTANGAGSNGIEVITSRLNAGYSKMPKTLASTRTISLFVNSPIHNAPANTYAKNAVPFSYRIEFLVCKNAYYNIRVLSRYDSAGAKLSDYSNNLSTWKALTDDQYTATASCGRLYCMTERTKSHTLDFSGLPAGATGTTLQVLAKWYQLAMPSSSFDINSGEPAFVKKTHTAVNVWLSWDASPTPTPSVTPTPPPSADAEGEVSGSVFEDVNGNGIEDSEDGPADDTQMILLDCSGDLVTTTTSNNGQYSFSGLLPGCYQVGAIPPDGLAATLKDQGDDDTKDSDINQDTLLTDDITLGNNETNSTVGAGFVTASEQGDTEDPTLTFTASPTSVATGSGSTLSWTATNASSCWASNGWIGWKNNSSGIEPSGSLTANTTFALECWNSVGVSTGKKLATVTVTGGTSPSTSPSASLPECSDGADNDGDGAVDCADNGCWVDVTDSSTCDPNDDSEFLPPPISPGPFQETE